MDNTVAFRFTGTIADVDETVDGDPEHPAHVLVIKIGVGHERVVIPGAVWTTSLELLQVGRRVNLSGQLGTSQSGLVPVAAHVELVGRLH